MILNGVDAVNASTLDPVYFETVLNKMIATASLTMPSPKMIENNLGYSSYFTIEIAAITSDEQSNELTSMLSIIDNENCSALYDKFIVSLLFPVLILVHHTCLHETPCQESE